MCSGTGREATTLAGRIGWLSLAAVAGVSAAGLGGRRDDQDQDRDDDDQGTEDSAGASSVPAWHRDLEGRSYWSDPVLDVPRKGSPKAFLLPNYDELFIGLRDRTAFAQRLKSAELITGGRAVVVDVNPRKRWSSGHIPGALNPMEMNIEKDEGIYREPNVWMVHEIG